MAELCREFSELVVDEVVSAPGDSRGRGVSKKMVFPTSMLRDLGHPGGGSSRDRKAQGHDELF